MDVRQGDEQLSRNVLAGEDELRGGRYFVAVDDAELNDAASPVTPAQGSHPQGSPTVAAIAVR